LEQAQTAQRMVADDKEDLERQLQDIGRAKVGHICGYFHNWCHPWKKKWFILYCSIVLIVGDNE